MHNLEMVKGQASMVYNSRYGSPWHTLGTPVEGAMTAAQALTVSKQDWEVIKRQLFTHSATGQAVMIPAWGIFRDDNGEFLGTCGEDYQPIQNSSQFEIIDYLLEGSDGAHYDTAGVLGRGERVWTLARIPEADITVAGVDRHEANLLACTSHDGSLAFTLKLTSTRVVCQNTLSMALQSNGALARVKHTKNALDRVEAAKRYMHMVAENSKTLSEKLNLLAGRKMTRESFKSSLDRLFPVSKDSKGDNLGQGRRDNLLADIVRLYESNDRNAVPEIRGTAYNLLNAVTEYTDHLRTTRISDEKKELGYTDDQARYESAIFNGGEALKNKAMEVIMEDTAGNPVITRQVFAVTSSQSTGSSLLDSICDAHPVAD